ncbi:unnamed protein product, partial [Cyprideis torosa]
KKAEASETLVQSLREQLKNADTRAKIAEDEKEALRLEVTALQQSRFSLEEKNAKLNSRLSQLARDKAASAASLEMLRAKAEEHKRRTPVESMEKMKLEAKMAAKRKAFRKLKIDETRKLRARLRALEEKVPTSSTSSSTSSRVMASSGPTSTQTPTPSPQNAVVVPIPSSSTTDAPHATVQPLVLASEGGTASPTRVRLPVRVSRSQATLSSEIVQPQLPARGDGSGCDE